MGGGFTARVEDIWGAVLRGGWRIFGWRFYGAGGGYLGGGFTGRVEDIWVAVLRGGVEDIWVRMQGRGVMPIRCVSWPSRLLCYSIWRSIPCSEMLTAPILNEILSHVYFVHESYGLSLVLILTDSLLMFFIVTLSIPSDLDWWC